MSRLRLSLLVLVLIAFSAACSKEKKENTGQQPPAVTQQNQQPTVQTASQEPPPEASASESSRELPSRSEAPAAAAQGKTVRSHKKAVTAREIPQTPSQAQQPVIANADVSTPAPAPTPAPARAVAEVPAPEVRQPRFITIPSGTVLHVRLQEPLDSGVNRSGDTFHAILDQDLRINGSLVAPRGSIAQGKLSNVESSGRIEGRASMTLQLVNLIIERQSYPVQTEILSRQGESVGKKTATKVGIGAGLGAVIGAIAGGGKGAAIGGAAGAGAGGVTAAATNRKELRLEAEDQLNFVLSRDVDVKVQ